MGNPRKSIEGSYLDWALPLLVALLLVLVIFKLHLSPGVDSMLNENNTIISNGFLSSQVDYHKELPAFARRPLTTALIETTARFHQITIGEAFILVTMFLLFLTGLSLFACTRKLGGSPGDGLLNMMVFYMGFSVVFAFFPPIFTYDEPLQYTLILLGFMALKSGYRIAFVLFFFLALIAKESTLLLFPGLLALFPHNGPFTKHFRNLRFWKDVGLLGIPVVLYALFLLIYLRENQLLAGSKVELAARFSGLSQNFATGRKAVETVISLLVTTGPFVFLLAVRGKQRRIRPEHRKWLNAFWISLLINTPIVVVATLAREARLFALPLIFLWPVFAQLFRSELQVLLEWRSYYKAFSNWQVLTGILLLGLINYLLAFKLYRPTFGSMKDHYFNEYLFLMLCVLGLYYFLKRYGRETRIS